MLARVVVAVGAGAGDRDGGHVDLAAVVQVVAHAGAAPAGEGREE
jgi:hypothetical protein